MSRTPQSREPDDEVAAYQKLLVAEPSREGLVQALDLVERVAGLRFATEPFEEAARKIEEEAAQEKLAQTHFADYLAEFMASDLAAREQKRQTNREHIRFSQLAQRAAHSMLIPRFRSEIGSPLSRAKWSLLLDAAFVAFHQSYFWLLDALPAPLKRARERLLLSYQYLAAALPDEADGARIMALVAEAAGNDDEALIRLEWVLHKTDPASHEFLTVVQSVWAKYIEMSRYNEAMLTLLRAMNDVGTEEYQELKGLIDETAESKWLNRSRP